MNRKALLVCALAAVLSMTSLTRGDFSVAGVTFEDTAQIDALLSYAGTYTTSGGSLASVLTDNTADTWAFNKDGTTTGAFLQLGFTDNFMVNGTGNDLAVFEIGSPVDLVPVALTVGGARVTKTPSYTGYTTGGYNINVAYWDLTTDFGLVANSLVSSIVIDMDDVAGGNPGHTIAFVGAINSQVVPVPGAVLLGVLGLSVAGARLRKRS